MDRIFILLNYLAMIGISAFFLLIIISSFFEKEYRAAKLSFIFLVLNISFWILLIKYNFYPFVNWINFFIFIFIGIFGLISLIKYFPEIEKQDYSRIIQFDERDHMFSRNNLRYYPELAEKYYKTHPDKRKIDFEIHRKPELGDKKQTYHDDYASPAFIAAFEYLDKTRTITYSKPQTNLKKLDKQKITDTIFELGKYYGAVDMGAVSLKKYHYYTNRGRHEENWGDKIIIKHKYAVIIIVAMNVGMMKAAPANNAIQESAKQYVEAAKISNIISEYIKQLGYDAKAQNDGNYETLCVPMAVDCGLGELGRMGLLVHPVYGPCVRIAAVTTDMELVTTERKNYAISQFCKICKKCSDNCPTESISKNDEPDKRGFKHWSINMEKCYAFWKNIGTDCGFCIRVCPYTKPNTLLHKLVRFYISRNSVNQHIALFFDDLLYGRNIKIPKENPKKIFKYNHK